MYFIYSQIQESVVKDELILFLSRFQLQILLTQFIIHRIEQNRPSGLQKKNQIKSPFGHCLQWQESNCWANQSHSAEIGSLQV